MAGRHPAILIERRHPLASEFERSLNALIERPSKAEIPWVVDERNSRVSNEGREQVAAGRRRFVIYDDQMIQLAQQRLQVDPDIFVRTEGNDDAP